MDINFFSDVSLVNMFSHSVGCLFILLTIPFPVQKRFNLMKSHLLISSFCFPCPRRYVKKNIAARNIWDFTAYVSSRSFIELSFTFKSLVYFEFILVYSVRNWSSFTFFMYLSNFPSTIYRTNCLYPIVFSYHFCQILINFMGVSLFLGSLLYVLISLVKY